MSDVKVIDLKETCTCGHPLADHSVYSGCRVLLGSTGSIPMHCPCTRMPPLRVTYDAPPETPA